MKLDQAVARPCRTCAVVTTDYRWTSDGYRRGPDCRGCQNAATNAWRHGLKPARYAALVAAGCAACGTLTAWRWHVDHDHACCSGQKTCGACFRGLLCAPCNLTAGHAGDDPSRLRAVADYLEGRHVNR